MTGETGETVLKGAKKTKKRIYIAKNIYTVYKE